MKGGGGSVFLQERMMKGLGRRRRENIIKTKHREVNLKVREVFQDNVVYRDSVGKDVAFANADSHGRVGRCLRQVGPARNFLSPQVHTVCKTNCMNRRTSQSWSITSFSLVVVVVVVCREGTLVGSGTTTTTNM
jgi:hypothetical protein